MLTMPTLMPDDNYARRTNHDYIGSFGRIPNEPKNAKKRPVHFERFSSRERFFLARTIFFLACEKFFLQMSTVSIFPSNFVGKSLIVNSTIENTSNHPSEKKIARFTF